MPGITVNLRPSTKQDLEALSIVRDQPMSEIAYEAMDEYLATEPRLVDAPKRDRSASATWFLRIDPVQQRRLEERALLEMGRPSSELGMTGRKTYKVSVLRRAIESYLDRLSPDERDKMEAQRNILEVVRS